MTASGARDAGEARSAHGSPAQADVRVIAFYLPQFHPIPENDAWWGEGFTEWTNVRKARPNFAGHYQPHVPGELGYYDLRNPDVREAQAALAREHGIHGFCYHYYWFSGKRLLEFPLDAVLASGRPDFPFCVCWANENWTRRWDGRDQEVLLAQRYSPADSLAFIRDLLPVFADRRYIRVGGRPLLIVYKADEIPDPAQTIALWRDEARRSGAGEIYLVVALTTLQADPELLGFDAAVEFPPHALSPISVAHRCDFTNADFAGSVFNYRSFVTQSLTKRMPGFKLFRTLVPGWDNTARRQDAGSVFVGSSPEIFGYWLERVVMQTRLRFEGDERLVFINAWNEWAEGCHLEPDERYGRQYLQAVSAALAVREPPPRPLRPPWGAVRALAESQAGVLRSVRSPTLPEPSSGTRVSVVMPAYNHAAYVPAALDSVLAQTHRNLEIIVVDDGSTDATAAVLDDYAARCRSHALTVVHQEHAGAHHALNRGLALARGEVIALINSDDLYAPTRLARLLEEMSRRRSAFAFSSTRFIDDDGNEVPASHADARPLREALLEPREGRDLLYVLVKTNIAISSGNFVFRRDLLERTGGFCSLRVCHDWDFVLAASRETPLAFLDEPLYLYRLHGENTYSHVRALAAFEADQVLSRFLADIAKHPIAREPAELARFLRYLRKAGLGGHLPQRQAAPA